MGYAAGVYVSEEDSIEGELKYGGHSVWGFVIYRTTYTPGREQEFADYINDMKELSDRHFGYTGDLDRDICTKLTWTVIEDKALLENVTKDTVRGLFDEWCKSDAPAAEQPDAKSPPGESFCVRYNYCLVVDDAALDSRLEYKSSGRGIDEVSFVNVVQRRYGDDDDELEDDEGEEDEEDDEEDDEDDGLSDIEGNTNEDVGWAKVRMAVYPGVYVDLCDPNAWQSHFYTRPPQISL